VAMWRTGELACLVNVGRNRARHIGVNPAQFRSRLHTHLFGDDRTPIAALRHKFRVSKALHKHDPRHAQCGPGPSRWWSACLKTRSRESTESLNRKRPMRSHHVPWDW